MADKPTEVKPKDCNCHWPRIRFRNGSGHALNCPVHQQWIKDKQASGWFGKQK